jgi:hypothetical protein
LFKAWDHLPRLFLWRLLRVYCSGPLHPSWLIVLSKKIRLRHFCYVLNTISLAEVLTAMDSGEPFSIGFRTCNVKKGTGGEWIEFPQCKKYKAKTKAEQYAEAHTPNKGRRDPKHFENSTRNIVVIPSGEIVKIHLRLIILFNSKTVI